MPTSTRCGPAVALAPLDLWIGVMLAVFPGSRAEIHKIMLLSTKALVGHALLARDGDIGRCKDFLFDDEKWAIRYMVADTGTWLPKRRVLISPIALGDIDWQSKRLHVRLLKSQIERAPRLDEDAPVSRQFEQQYAAYYGYRPYWRGASLWGVVEFPGALYEDVRKDAEVLTEPEGDPHLRSIDEVVGYHIEASDGTFGHIEDFIIDEESWKIQYLVIDTRNWFPSSKVIVPPEWIESVDWAASIVKVPMTKEHIKGAPEYDPHAPVNRVYEARLYDYYGRPHHR